MGILYPFAYPQCQYRQKAHGHDDPQPIQDDQKLQVSRTRAPKHSRLEHLVQLGSLTSLTLRFD